MGWIRKAVVLFIGLALLGTGFWPFGILCFGYLVLALRSGGGKGAPSPSRGRPGVSPRYLLAGALVVLSLVAFASGGTFSPILFVSLAAVVLAWPMLPFSAFFSRVAPLEGTILLRSTAIPFVWHSVAEVKPGAEDLARALSSYEGRLMIAKPGIVYAHVKAFAFDARSAEWKVTQEFRKIASSVQPGGAYLLPLDSAASSQAFRKKISPAPTTGDALASPSPDLLVIDSSGGFVSRSGSYSTAPGPASRPVFPVRTRTLRKSPLTWEVLESLGKKLRWPEPDSFSNLLQSVHATRQEALSERLANLESSGAKVKVQALGGEEVELSRAQLRAILSIYS
jgi:hypothetical protein